MKTKLTPKQKQFCKEYLIDLNATQAAIRAGYAKKGAKVRGSELLTNRNLQPYLAELKADRSERVHVDQDFVLSNLIKIVEMSMRAVPVMEKIDGKLVKSGEYRYDSSGANKALELLGKHLNIFTDKKIIEFEGESITLNQVVNNISGKTKEELLEMLNSGERKYKTLGKESNGPVNRLRDAGIVSPDNA